MKRDKSVTRKKLIEAFWSIYCEKDIGKITIKEITERSGHYRSTFYIHFLDVYDVLESIETEIIEEIVENLPTNIYAEMSESFVDSIAKLYKANGAYISTLLGENGDPAFVDKLKKAIIPKVFPNLGEDNEGTYKRLIIEYNLSGILYTIKYWYENEQDLDSKSLLLLIRNIMRHGSLQELIE